VELDDFNKAMEALKEEHQHSTNSARIWEQFGQHFPADREFKSNKDFREAIMTWHNDIKPESKAQYISVLMSAFYQQKMHHDKPGMSTSTLPQKDWERVLLTKFALLL
jgi:hypothetical protein